MAQHSMDVKVDFYQIKVSPKEKNKQPELFDTDTDTKYDISSFALCEAFVSPSSGEIESNAIHEMYTKFIEESSDEYIDSGKGKCIFFQKSYKGSENNREFFIMGRFNAGQTGSGAQVMKKKKPDRETDNIIDNNHVAALEFCYFLWFPLDLHYGLLAIHSYSDAQYATDFVRPFQVYANKYIREKSVLSIAPYKPKAVVQAFVDEGIIHKIQYIKIIKEINEGNETTLGKFKNYLAPAGKEKMKKETVLSGLKRKVKKLYKKDLTFDYGLLKEISINEGDVDVVKLHVNFNSRKYIMTVDEKMSTPAFYLDHKNLDCDADTGRPNIEIIEEYISKLMQEVRESIYENQLE